MPYSSDPGATRAVPGDGGVPSGEDASASRSARSDAFGVDGSVGKLAVADGLLGRGTVEAGGALSSDGVVFSSSSPLVGLLFGCCISVATLLCGADAIFFSCRICFCAGDFGSSSVSFLC